MNRTSLLIVLFAILSTISFSQTSELCGFAPENDPYVPGAYTASIDPAYLNTFQPVVFNIFFWAVEQENAPGGESCYVTENDALAVVAKLNMAYNEFNVFFKYKGLDCFESNTYYILENPSHISSLYSFAQSNGYVMEDAFNFYIPNTIEGASGAVRNYNTNDLYVEYTALTSATPIHEIGHNFHLIHTFEYWDESYCEHVTRDTGAINYNANTNGDRVHDTAAVSRFNHQTYLFYPECRYVGDTNPPCSKPSSPGCHTMDCEGTPYVVYEVDETNYMTSGTGPCKELFTTGQMIRIREAIQNDSNGVFGDSETTLASLYEPYSGEYNNELPGTSPLFQPGFDYEFVECCCDYTLPSDYTDISFTYNSSNIVSSFDADETNYSSIIHPNHSAIRITQVPDPTGNIYQPRRCYDNNPPKPLSGTITKFNDDTLNTNVTIIELNEKEINDPYLFDRLERGLYKIKKTYSDGSTSERVIFKKVDKKEQ